MQNFALGALTYPHFWHVLLCGIPPGGGGGETVVGAGAGGAGTGATGEDTEL